MIIAGVKPHKFCLLWDTEEVEKQIAYKHTHYDIVVPYIVCYFSSDYAQKAINNRLLFSLRIIVFGQ